MPLDPQTLAERASATMDAGDHAAHLLGIVLEQVGPGHARMSMEITKAMLNGHAVCHGGMLFTLADTAFAHACNSRNIVTVASGAEISFLSPVRLGERLVATASERALPGRTGIYDVEIRAAGDERLVALFRGRSHATNRNLLPAEETGF